MNPKKIFLWVLGIGIFFPIPRTSGIFAQGTQTSKTDQESLQLLVAAINQKKTGMWYRQNTTGVDLSKNTLWIYREKRFWRKVAVMERDPYTYRLEIFGDPENPNAADSDDRTPIAKLVGMIFTVSNSEDLTYHRFLTDPNGEKVLKYYLGSDRGAYLGPVPDVPERFLSVKKAWLDAIQSGELRILP